MTRTGFTLRRKLAVSTIAVAVAASLTLALPASTATAQDAGPFPDTPAGAFYAQAVETLNQDGVFAGTLCDDGFCPSLPLDRATMAVWTVRVLDEQDPPAVTSTRFADVDATHPHAAFIERFAELEVTRGCGDGTNYCPDDGVSRAHMAVFLSRAFALAAGPDPNFGDVAADAWYAPDVAKLVATGITRGCGDGANFCPGQLTTRAQMATFLARALALPETPEEPPDVAPTSGFTSVSAGDRHACAIHVDKSVVCWGDDSQGQSSPPLFGEFTAVSAGGLHSCALRASQRLSCWGDDRYEQSSPPKGEFIAVSSGFWHSCAVSVLEDKDLSVQCWGFDGTGPPAPLPGLYSDVSAGLEHTCGLRTDKVVQCWGNNSYSQAGEPTSSVTCTVTGCRPNFAPLSGEFVSVAAGGTHTCSLRFDNRIRCLGDNTEGQTSPPSGQFLALSAGFRHSCALATDNTAHCWGRDLFGETNAPDGAFASVSAGTSFSCGLRPDNTIECWGNAADGRTMPPIN